MFILTSIKYEPVAVIQKVLEMSNLVLIIIMYLLQLQKMALSKYGIPERPTSVLISFLLIMAQYFLAIGIQNSNFWLLQVVIRPSK